MSARTIAAALSGASNSAEPSPFLTILGIGQPMFISIISQSSLSATRAKSSGSLPNSCMHDGFSLSANRISGAVLTLPYISPRTDTISLTVSPAP